MDPKRMIGGHRGEYVCLFWTGNVNVYIARVAISADVDARVWLEWRRKRRQVNVVRIVNKPTTTRQVKGCHGMYSSNLTVWSDRISWSGRLSQGTQKYILGQNELAKRKLPAAHSTKLFWFPNNSLLRYLESSTLIKSLNYTRIPKRKMGNFQLPCDSLSSPSQVWSPKFRSKRNS